MHKSKILSLSKLRLFSILTFIKACRKSGVSPQDFLSLNYDYLSLDKGHYSKHKINKQIPQKYRLETKLVKTSKDCFSYPYILKPDWGESSFGVCKITSEKDASNMIRGATRKDVSYIAQQYCNFKYEYDILYIRLESGEIKILDVTQITLPSITGDGKSTLKQLIQSQFKHNAALLRINKDNFDFLTEYPFLLTLIH
jgi:hypothetical protein